MENNKKKLLILVLILAFIYFIISVFSFVFNSKTYKKTVFIGDYTKIKVNGSNLSIEYNNEEINNQKVKLYFQNEIIDGYITSENDGINGGMNKYTAYNDDGEVLLYNSSIIGYTKDLSLKFIDVEKRISSKRDEVNLIFESSKMSKPENYKLSFMYVYSFDLEDDGEKEYIYSINLIEDNSKFDSMLFYKKDDKYILIDRVESESISVNYTSLFFIGLIDFDNDNEYTFAVGKSLGEYGPVYTELYNYDGIEFTKIGGE